jgi:hypothetical protein
MALRSLRYLTHLPAALRSRVAITGLVGSLLIPVATTTLRGQQQLVSCVDETEQSFSVTPYGKKQAIVTGSTSITREPRTGDCANLAMNMAVKPDGEGFILILMPVVNKSDLAWSTSVILKIDDLQTSISVGKVRPGQTVTKQLRVELTKELKSITGTLVLGP